MIDLYRTNGGPPEELPAVMYDSQNRAFTQPYAPETLRLFSATFFARYDPAAEYVHSTNDGGFEVRPIPPAPSVPIGVEDIDRERDRRIADDIEYRGAIFQADETAQRRIEKARISALAAVTAGAQRGDYRWHGQDVDFTWIAKNNDRVKMDAQTLLEFGNMLAAREGLLIMAGSDLKNRLEAGEKIEDVTRDDLW